MVSKLSLLAAMLVAFPLAAQEVEMADSMRADGKINVLVAIILVVLAGLIGYIVLLDRKARRLEKKLEEKN
ncbi:MAG: CcmD family protein [Cyclobacteriaceae bacterium]|nr:CcmD family protein [Cyclobacteriaceae bacterium]